jgi:protein subunit release factor A
MELRGEDFRIDRYRTASGAVGVRVIHLPTGASASVDDQPTAAENRERALNIVRQELARRDA